MLKVVVFVFSERISDSTLDYKDFVNPTGCRS
jgi:hypothetical protein